MASADEIRDGTDRSTHLTLKIAQLLGCSLDAFSNPSSPKIDQTSELLQAWLMIRHEQDRKKVLSFVRMIADQADVRREP